MVNITKVQHVNLTTGNWGESQILGGLCHADAPYVALVRELKTKVPETELNPRLPIPGRPGYVISGHTSPGSLFVVVFEPSPRPWPRLCSLGIALDERGSSMWNALYASFHGPGRPPAPVGPWVARIPTTRRDLHADEESWLGELEVRLTHALNVVEREDG